MENIEENSSFHITINQIIASNIVMLIMCILCSLIFIYSGWFIIIIILYIRYILLDLNYLNSLYNYIIKKLNLNLIETQASNMVSSLDNSYITYNDKKYNINLSNLQVNPNTIRDFAFSYNRVNDYYKKNKRYLSTYCSGSEVVSALFLEEISKINKEKILLEVGKDPKYFSKISFEDFFKKFHILNINYNYWAINKTLFILDLFKKFAQILFPDPNLLKKKFYLIPMSQFIRGNDLDNFLKVGKFLVLITAISHSAIVGYSTNSSVDEALLDRFSQNIDVEYNKINSFNMIYNVFINFMINNNKLPFFLSESKNYSQVILHMLNLNNHLTTVENVLDYVKQISDIIEDENKNKKNGVWEKNIINRLKNGMLD